MDILLDEETHDCIFINGQTPVTEDIPDNLKQRLKIKFLTFKGEWFLNTNYGTPYYQEIFGKRRSKSVVDTIFRDLILQDNDVVQILNFTSQLTPERHYLLSFSVRSVTGETVEIEELEVNI